MICRGSPLIIGQRRRFQPLRGGCRSSRRRGSFLLGAAPPDGSASFETALAVAQRLSSSSASVTTGSMFVNLRTADDPVWLIICGNAETSASDVGLVGIGLVWVGSAAPTEKCRSPCETSSSTAGRLAAGISRLRVIHPPVWWVVSGPMPGAIFIASPATYFSLMGLRAKAWRSSRHRRDHLSLPAAPRTEALHILCYLKLLKDHHP